MTLKTTRTVFGSVLHHTGKYLTIPEHLEPPIRYPLWTEVRDLSVVFLEIHPFQDGNGRLSRILTTLLLLRAGYGYVPYSSLESVIEKSKDAYYLALRQTQRTIRTPTPDWQPWLIFFLKSLQQQKARLEKKVERGRLTVAGAAKVTGASRNTIKDHLKALTRAGHIERHGAGRGTWYGLA